MESALQDSDSWHASLEHKLVQLQAIEDSFDDPCCHAIARLCVAYARARDSKMQNGELASALEDAESTIAQTAISQIEAEEYVRWTMRARAIIDNATALEAALQRPMFDLPAYPWSARALAWTGIDLALHFWGITQPEAARQWLSISEQQLPLLEQAMPWEYEIVLGQLVHVAYKLGEQAYLKRAVMQMFQHFQKVESPALRAEYLRSLHSVQLKMGMQHEARITQAAIDHSAPAHVAPALPDFAQVEAPGAATLPGESAWRRALAMVESAERNGSRLHGLIALVDLWLSEREHIQGA